MPRYQYSTERKPLATSPMRTCKEAQTHARGERCVFIIKPLFMSSVAHHWTCKSFKDRATGNHTSFASQIWRFLIFSPQIKHAIAKVIRKHQTSSCIQGYSKETSLPSNNQTWQWQILHSWMIFPLKPSLTKDFPWFPIAIFYHRRVYNFCLWSWSRFHGICETFEAVLLFDLRSGFLSRRNLDIMKVHTVCIYVCFTYLFVYNIYIYIYIYSYIPVDIYIYILYICVCVRTCVHVRFKV